MSDWLSALTFLCDDAVPAVLVTVIGVEGSSPREAGAKMVFTRDRQFDTIGGGHLELRATEVAREMLASAAPEYERRIQRFALGPSLGQCCGGVVHLLFEPIAPASREWIRRLHERRAGGQDSWRLVALDAADAPALPAVLDDGGKSLTNQAAAVGFDPEQPCHIVQDSAGRRWLVDPCLAHRSRLYLFGAGHVGAAIVRALADLPCQVTWVDEREDIFPAQVPPNVKIEATDTPEAVVDAAPAGASYLVMTHSHALDQRLAETILCRQDVGWFGLIGSQTKRTQFERRLRERGIAPQRLADMTCPIGIPGITGKAPAVIAASVCAQLLLLWEAQERERQTASDRIRAIG
ncbi:xanthine dehydrogenase accessory protein XdhC [Noviherbaspirillum massiliense]|uniref:xanthine dehydrogenase accessory protein XdhC n=1 Tax=Noviherbaspirillum massiliense TaxID=1465823 RepID=UPI0002F4F700|nr:xanthine dehydrogenase accessory protein XdhC [Noviherbaspirillum massiliense]